MAARPRGVVGLVGGGGAGGGADPGDAVAVEDDGGVLDEAEGAVAEGGVVGDEAADVGDDGAHGFLSGGCFPYPPLPVTGAPPRSPGRA